MAMTSAEKQRAYIARLKAKPATVVEVPVVVEREVVVERVVEAPSAAGMVSKAAVERLLEDLAARRALSTPALSFALKRLKEL